jgi:hypothetical protein
LTPPTFTHPDPDDPLYDPEDQNYERDPADFLSLWDEEEPDPTRDDGGYA